MGLNDIDIIYALFNYYEIYGRINNGNKFKEIIDAINKRLNTSYDYNLHISKLSDDEQDIAAGLFAIDTLVFDECYQEYILALLGNNHYYMKTFIKIFIKFLGNAKTQEERDKIIDRYQKLLLINNVKYNGVDSYTIQSAYGDYSFTLADKVLEDKYLVSYIRNGDHRKTCHENATRLLNTYDDLYTICSLVRSYFIGYYYHSYSYIKEKNLVLDICSNMLMEKGEFDDLFGVRELLNMRNDELRKEYITSIRQVKSKLDDESVLKCALYHQAKDLDNNPDEKKIILDYNRLVLQGSK